MQVDVYTWLRGLSRAPQQLSGDVLPRLPESEARLLAGYCSRYAPVRTGRLRRSFSARGPDVVSTAPYARIVSEGGVVRAKRYPFLTIPLRDGYARGQGNISVPDGKGGQYVFQRGTRGLIAVRRREVRIPGNGYLQRALEAYQADARQRIGADIARRFAAEVNRG